MASGVLQNLPGDGLRRSGLIVLSQWTISRRRPGSRATSPAGTPWTTCGASWRSSSPYASLRQPQLELTPFDRDRLKEVALKLRELYPVGDRARFTEKITLTYIDRLIDKVTEGFAGDVGVIPRQFLRHLVDIMDLAAEHDDFDPMTAEGFAPREPSEEENRLMAGQGTYDEEPEDEAGYEPVEF